MPWMPAPTTTKRAAAGRGLTSSIGMTAGFWSTPPSSLGKGRSRNGYHWLWSDGLGTCVVVVIGGRLSERGQARSVPLDVASCGRQTGRVAMVRIGTDETK